MIGSIIAKAAIRNTFNALNRRDLDLFMSKWHSEGVFVYPGNIKPSGIFRGLPAIRSWFSEFFEQYPTICFDIKSISVSNLFDIVGCNQISVYWDIAVENKNGRKSSYEGVTIIDIRFGRVIQAKDFLFSLGDDFLVNWGVKN